MRKKRIPRHLREPVRAKSPRRCAYCHSPERLIGMRLEIDHIIPEAAGGATILVNLCLICRRCNSYKHTQTHARDPITRRRVLLFHPNRQKWERHFAWSEDGTYIIGLTACGRATVEALHMNDELIVALRQMWMEDGRHPKQGRDF
jgi:hypothetical protein